MVCLLRNDYKPGAPKLAAPGGSKSSIICLFYLGRVFEFSEKHCTPDARLGWAGPDAGKLQKMKEGADSHLLFFQNSMNSLIHLF